MVNGIRMIYPHGLNNGFGSNFCVSFCMKHLKKAEEYEDNNKDEDQIL